MVTQFSPCLPSVWDLHKTVPSHDLENVEKIEPSFFATKTKKHLLSLSQTKKYFFSDGKINVGIFKVEHEQHEQHEQHEHDATSRIFSNPNPCIFHPRYSEPHTAPHRDLLEVIDGNVVALSRRSSLLSRRSPDEKSMQTEQLFFFEKKNPDDAQRMCFKKK